MKKYPRRCFFHDAQINLPLPTPSMSLDSGIERTMLRTLRRKFRRSEPIIAAVAQLSIDFSEKWKFRSRGTRRPAKFPFEIVLYARKLRGFGFEYHEISQEIGHKFKAKVPWITVRDWVNFFYRVSE